MRCVPIYQSDEYYILSYGNGTACEFGTVNGKSVYFQGDDTSDEIEQWELAFPTRNTSRLLESLWEKYCDLAE